MSPLEYPPEAAAAFHERARADRDRLTERDEENE